MTTPTNNRRRLSLIEKLYKKYNKADKNMKAILNEYGCLEQLNAQRKLYTHTRLSKYHKADRDFQKYHYYKRNIEKIRADSQKHDPV